MEAKMKFYTSGRNCIYDLTCVRAKDATRSSRNFDRVVSKVAATKARKESKFLIEQGVDEYEFWGDLLSELKLCN